MSIVQGEISPELPIPFRTLDAGPIGLPVVHRIAEVRREQNVSVRLLARRMKTSDALVRQQEEQTCDLPLSVLYKWQAALDVPIDELLVVPGSGLSPNVKSRAALIKLMKTARSIEQRIDSEPLRYLVHGLVTQLIELMPELASVDAWPAVGNRRTRAEMSPIEERVIPAGLLDGAWVSGEGSAELR